MSINRGMDKEAVIHIYNGILLTHKKNEIMPFAATWMDLEIIILSKSDRERQSYDIAYMKNLKEGYKSTYLQDRNRLADLENKLMVTKGERWGDGGINWEIEIDIYTLLYLK